VETEMTIITIDAARAHAMLRDGALLIDIRDRDEHARERIPAAKNIPLSKLCDSDVKISGKPLIYHCKSGNRTRMNAELLLRASPAQVPAQVHVLEGGIEGWKAAGFTVSVDTRQPLEMMRQVQISAGGLALAGAVLGYTVNPAFYALSGAVGIGLLFSGITGSCAMASLLKAMPWNRVVA
jgi:rhodanese-related sulfurtransferase